MRRALLCWFACGLCWAGVAFDAAARWKKARLQSHTVVNMLVSACIGQAGDSDSDGEDSAASARDVKREQL